MKNKGILKFKGTESSGAMHFITYNGDTVSLTMSSSRKINHIKANKVIAIADSLVSRKFNDIEVEIVTNGTYVNEVFEYMKTEKHTHYKKDNTGLVVLKYKLA